MKQSMYLLTVLFLSCSGLPEKNNPATMITEVKTPANLSFDTTIKTAHILVALCDNKYQGIVPVPAAIGNGDDLNNNLYWGCSNGIRSYFKKSTGWMLVKKMTIDSIRMERLVFKNKQDNFYLVCDAYRGKNIKDCTIDFLNSCAGLLKGRMQIDNHVIGLNGNAKLLAYIGHDGLMDFTLNQQFKNTDQKTRDVVILACKSRQYFSGFMQQAKARPLLWTSNLMCPEAYTLHDLLTVYVKDNNDLKQMNLMAARAYSKYQKCSLKGAQNLLVTGF